MTSTKYLAAGLAAAVVAGHASAQVSISPAPGGVGITGPAGNTITLGSGGVGVIPSGSYLPGNGFYNQSGGYLPSNGYYDQSGSYYTPSNSYYAPNTGYYSSGSYYTPSTSYYAPSTQFYTPSTSFYTPSTGYYTPATSWGSGNGVGNGYYRTYSIPGTGGRVRVRR